MMSFTKERDIPSMKVGSIDWFKFIKNKVPLILLFYRGNWSKSCKLYLSEMNSYIEDLSKLGFRVYGLSCQSKEDCRSLEDELFLQYPLVSCPDDSLASYLLNNDFVDLTITTNPEYSQTKVIHPGVLVIDQHGIILSWAQNSHEFMDSTRPRARDIVETIRNELHDNNPPALTPVMSKNGISRIQCTPSVGHGDNTFCDVEDLPCTVM